MKSAVVSNITDNRFAVVVNIIDGDVCRDLKKYIQYKYTTVYATWQMEMKQNCQNCRDAASQRAAFQLPVLRTDHCSLGFHLTQISASKRLKAPVSVFWCERYPVSV